MLAHCHGCSFYFNHAAPPETYTLSLHDALPICTHRRAPHLGTRGSRGVAGSWCHRHDLELDGGHLRLGSGHDRDRKSTRLNSSHSQISYAVFCLKKKKYTTHYPNCSRVRCTPCI